MHFTKQLIAVSAAVLFCGTAALAGSSRIDITAPQITGTTPATAAVAANLQTELNNQIQAVEDTLNNDYFSKYHDQTDLARGFANAGAVTRDNASMMGFQNYDLFCVMLGANMGFAYPSMSPSEISQSFKDIKGKGDVYAGMGTGGFAGQVGVNTSFLVDNLYLSAKFGTFSYDTKFGDTSLKIDQYMIGVGANYRLFSSWDFLFGFAKWRGLSLGSGFVYNSASASISIPVDNQPFSASYGGYTLNGDVTNIGARLSIDSSSFVIPLEATTSVQVLWLFNLGVGAGVDLIIPSSTVKLGGKADVALDPQTGFSSTAGSVKVTGTNSENKLKFTDVVAPRLAADLGFNISVVKIDIPFNWYPVTKAVSVGMSAGVAW